MHDYGALFAQNRTNNAYFDAFLTQNGVFVYD